MRLLLKRNASNSKLKGSIIMATQTKAEASRYYQLYNSARYYLFLIFALAVVNCFYCLSDGYFVLAPYESTVLLGIGLGMSAEAGSMVFYVIAAVLCVVVAVPYLLGGIFSKSTGAGCWHVPSCTALTSVFCCWMRSQEAWIRSYTSCLTCCSTVFVWLS